jgi:hypothetical protein
MPEADDPEKIVAAGTAKAPVPYVDIVADRLAEFLTANPTAKVGEVESSKTDFTLQDVATFARTIRELRNALAHGRDQKTGTTITPTVHNFAKLQPWLGPTALVASQVLIYKEVF